MFEFSYIDDLWPWSKNDIDLQYPHQGQGHSRVIIYTSYDGQKSPIYVKIGLPVPEKKMGVMAIWL